MRVELEPDVKDVREATDAVESAPQALWDRLVVEAQGVMDRAVQAWPVRSGTSRGAFVLRTPQDAAEIANVAPYAFAVRRGGVNAWNALVRWPADERLDRLDADLADIGADRIAED